MYLIPSLILCHLSCSINHIHDYNFTLRPLGSSSKSLNLEVVLGSFNASDRPWIIWDVRTATPKSLQSCPTLCDPIDGSPPGSPVLGILQARTLEWVAISFSNAWKWEVKSESEVTQSCMTLRDPMDYSLPGSSVHGIFQARVLEWGAIAFSGCKDYWVSIYLLFFFVLSSHFINF